MWKSSMWPASVAFVAAVVVCLPVAQAQDTRGSLDDEARALFMAGQTAFEDGRFGDALTDFERAYGLSHRPALLFNIGQCHDHLRHDEEAVTAFEGYLAAVPDAPARHVIEARLAILREAVAHETAAPQPPDVPVSTAEESPEAPPTQRETNLTGWVLLGVGGVVAIVGAVLVGVAFADIGTVEAAAGVPFASVRDANDRAPIESGIGWAMLAAGAAVATVGIVIAVTSGGSQDASATLRLGPGSISVAGTF